MTSMRITGTNSGLDVDALVKKALTGYQSKVDTEVQNKQILTYQQEQYRKIMSDSNDFLSKYLDVSKTGSLLLSTTYETVKFTSAEGEDTKVTARGFGGASVDNYKVSVTQLAAKATTTFSNTALSGKVNKITGATAGVLYVNGNASTGGRDVYVDLATTERKDSSGNYLDLNDNKIYKQSNDKFLRKDDDGTLRDNAGLKVIKQSDGTFTYEDGITVLTDDKYSKQTYEVDMKQTAENLNKQLTNGNLGVTAKYSDYSKGIVLESSTMGSTQKFSAMFADFATYTNVDGTIATKASEITDAEKTTIVTAANTVANTKIGKDLAGTVTKIGSSDTPYALTGTSNTVNIDNVQFSLRGVTTTGTAGADEPVSLTGKADVTGLKDKIVKFVDDYNTLMKSINTKIYEDRDKDYKPLTDAQREAMSDTQIEKWEAKVEKGLIRKDRDLEKLTSSMKAAMSNIVGGLDLEKIGITPVQDYTSKNGMLSLEEDKLTKALEENSGNVKDLFMKAASKTDSTDKGGVLTQLKAVFDAQTKSSSSSLAKKAGLEGTSTESNNEITKNIAKKKTLISQLNTKMSDKETSLYKQYSALETAMQTLNSQQMSLAALLGNN